MVSHNKPNDASLEDLRKSVDRLVIIELVKAGATRDQIREVMGAIGNNQLSTIKRAMGNKRNAEER